MHKVRPVVLAGLPFWSPLGPGARSGKVDTGFPLGQTRYAFCPEIMLKQKTERDDDSNKRHHAPVFQVLEARSGKVGPGFPVRSRIHLARPEEEP
jgi:hypothetical protein